MTNDWTPPRSNHELWDDAAFAKYIDSSTSSTSNKSKKRQDSQQLFEDFDTPPRRAPNEREL